MKESQIYQFGDFTIDLEQNTLSCNGKSLPITPKCFRLLSLLVRNCGKIVLKEEIMADVWENSFVEESNLTYNIRQLRKILDDDFSNPKFIETVPKRGYRFIGEINQNETPLEEGENTKEFSTANKRIKAFEVVLAAGIIIFGLSITFWLIKAKTNPKKESISILANKFESVSLSLTEESLYAAISPNGNLVAYVQRNNGKSSVWLKELKTGNNVELIKPSDDSYFGLVFSRNNEEIFLSVKTRNVGNIDIYRVSIVGGMLVKILENVQGNLSISPDNQSVSFVRFEPNEAAPNSLWIAGIDGSNQQRIATRNRQFDIGDNEWSPDGKTIIFANGHADNASRFYSVSSVDIETKEERFVFENKFFHIKNLQSLPGGDEFLLTGNLTIDEPARIWRVSVRSGEYEQLTSTPDSFRGLSISNAADVLVTTVIKSDFKIHAYDAENPKNFEVLNEANSFCVAPDGEIVYSSRAGGNTDIWSMNADGSNRKQLTNDPGRDFNPQVSPNGKYIFFTSSRTGMDQVWRMNSDGGNQILITINEGGYPVFVNGSNVFYRTALKHSLWKAGINGKDETVVLDHSGSNYALSRDGSKVAYFGRKNDKTHLIVYSLLEDAEKNAFAIEDDSSIAVLNWVNDDSALIYMLFQKSVGYSLFEQSITGIKPTKINDFGKTEIPAQSGFSYIAAKNKYLLIRGGYKQDIVLIKGLR